MSHVKKKAILENYRWCKTFPLEFLKTSDYDSEKDGKVHETLQQNIY